MLRALEQIRRMRGGAQSHLMRCDDGYYYVVKFQNNPQHTRVLVNELLGTRLASRLGLPTTPAAIISVSEDLIRLTPDLCMEMPRARIPCRAGLQFGSRYPGDPHRLTLLDFFAGQTVDGGREPASVSGHASFRQMDVQHEWPANSFFQGTAGRSRSRVAISRGDDRPGFLLQCRGVEFSRRAVARAIRPQPRL